VDSVFIPGDKEDQFRQNRLIDGIPLDQTTIKLLEELAMESELSMPLAMNI